MTTALLFPLPIRNRPLSVMRNAILQRLDNLGDEAQDWTDSQFNLSRRLERLLLCVENKLAPKLAEQRERLHREALRRQKDEALQGEIEIERKQDLLIVRINSDPRMVAALALLESAGAKAREAEKAEDAAMAKALAAPFPENAQLLHKMPPIKGKTTRALNAENKAAATVTCLRYSLEKEFRRNT